MKFSLKILFACVVTSSLMASLADLPPPPSIPNATSDTTSSASSDAGSASAAMPAPGIPTLPAPVVPAVTPAPAPVPAVPVSSPAVMPAEDKPAQAMPAATSPAENKSPSVGVASIKALDAKPLFVTTGDQPAVVSGGSIKDLYASSEGDENRAQAVLTSLEAAKSKAMDDYLALDGELDTLYEEVGVSRGNAMKDLSNAKQHIVDNTDAKIGVNNETQALIAAEREITDTLSKSIEALRVNEAKVISTVKVFSDFVLALNDDQAAIATQRESLRIATDEATGRSIASKIKDMADKMAASEKSANGSGGSAALFQDAMVKIKETIAAVKKASDDLKQKNISIKDAVKKSETGALAENTETVLASDKKKSKKIAFDRWRSAVKGTVFEAPYEIVFAIWTSLAPLRERLVAVCMHVYDGVHYLVVGKSEDDHVLDKPLADPVLERIRQERNQSHKKVQSLAAEREVIELKSTLLDRLEAERIMQLDKKETLSKEISRAYSRKERELSWFDLLQRVVWKLYATVKRMVSSIVSWWRDEELTSAQTLVSEKKTGVGEVKIEVNAPITTPKTVAPAIAVSAPVSPAPIPPAKK